ncbi:hypothetical protein D3C85_1056490 [compost metagenome]
MTAAKRSCWSRPIACLPLRQWTLEKPWAWASSAITEAKLTSSSTISTAGPWPLRSGCAGASSSFGWLAATATGNRTLKREPRPGTLSRLISPSRASTSWRVMASPRPVPPKRRLVEPSICWKAWNMRSCWSSDMPMPVSRTAKRSTSRSSAAAVGSSSTESSTSPCSVNFSALDSRLRSIWCRRTRSLWITRGTPAWTWVISRRPLISAMGRRLPSSSASMSWTFSGSSLSCMRPASTLARSRTSLISCRRSLPARWTMSAWRVCFSVRLPTMFCRNWSLRMRMLFSGVRSSWDMLARNSDL